MNAIYKIEKSYQYNKKVNISKLINHKKHIYNLFLSR